MVARLRSYIESLSVQRRSLGIVFFVIGMLALLQVAEYATVSYYTHNWDTIAESKSNEQLAAIRTEFSSVQRKARRIAAELARHEDVTRYLTGKTNDVDVLFSQCARISRNQDVGTEVFDKRGMLVAWHGRSGIVNQREITVALQGVLTSYVTRGPIFSQLFVITPVRVEGEVVGAVLIRQTIEVNYPLSNKFITPAGLAKKLSEDFGVNVDINYSENAEPPKDGRYASTVLSGIDGRKLGVASILKLSRSAYLELIAARFHKVKVGLLLLGMFVLTLYAARVVSNLKSLFFRIVGITAVIWIVRYLLLWLEVPPILVQWSIFDPSHFASKFGNGLAKSVGEVTLTSLALGINVAGVLRFIQEKPSGMVEKKMWLPLRILAAAGVTAIMYLLLRGYAATIRSAVIDSNFRFNDPTVIVPSLELALMVFNLFVISVSLIVVSVALTRFVVSWFERDRTGRDIKPWIVMALLYVLASILLDVVQETPLMSTSFRLFFGAGILIFAFFVHRNRRYRQRPILLGNAVSVLALSAIFFYPLLSQVIQERDRERVELFARDVLRPTDAWFTFSINEALQSFVTDDAFDVLLHGDKEELERLAFTSWAGSNAAQQGFNCSFTIYAPDGREISRFAIGEQSAAAQEASLAVLRNHSTQIDVREAGSGMEAIKVYAGALPIRAADELLGYGVVVISAAQQSLFRGESPRVFQTASHEKIESFYRPISVAEFKGERALSSGDLTLPVGYSIPAKVRERFKDSTVTSLWIHETIAGKDYETYFARRLPSADRVVALRMEALGFFWHVFGIVRSLVYFGFVLIGGFAVFLVVQWARGKPYRFTFRDRLLVALLIVSALPVIIISNYTRSFARERVEEYLAQRLSQETQMMEDKLTPVASRDSLIRHLASDASTEHLVSDMRSDFNIYVGNMLFVSSRPELYESGILDRRLSGTAYAEIFVVGKRFHFEMENIGLYRYAVGYKPIVDAAESIIGVIAVPTLYRQDQIDEDVARTNAFLFGVSAIIFIGMALLAIAFANRIAAPIQKLTEATKRVSQGDLDVKVGIKAVGEIEELVRSFETMTKDLKRNRENLVQYERELAWKEMAKQVAHEIKNPLTPMKLAIQHLRQTYRDKVENFDEIFEEISQMVIRQVDALGRIASEFSSFARMPSARLERCSINDIVREAAYLFEQDQKVEFSITLEQHLPPIMADREELRRAFINIIRNGIQAMDGEGRVEVSSADAGTDIEIRIRDFGCGIADDIRSKLFQPNFSTKTDGMGLGLAIVKKTIEDMNGSITIESIVNEGTTVIIRIPKVTADDGRDTNH